LDHRQAAHIQDTLLGVAGNKEEGQNEQRVQLHSLDERMNDSSFAPLNQGKPPFQISFHCIINIGNPFL